MAHEDVAQQTLLEHALLKHVTEALRVSAGWSAEGDDLSRNLSTLRFIAGSFQRHLERLMALEEHDGYMDVVVSASPRLAKTVDALREEHGQFRGAVRRITQRLEQVSATDHAAFAAARDELLGFLDRVDRHGDKESKLIHEALARDAEGGEGG
jgi:hemerythrin-like domain-containing protein